MSKRHKKNGRGGGRKAISRQTTSHQAISQQTTSQVTNILLAGRQVANGYPGIALALGDHGTLRL